MMQPVLFDTINYAESMKEAARIIRHRMTGVSDEKAWQVLSNAQNYLWRQADREESAAIDEPLFVIEWRHKVTGELL
jgi:hypothetical protein